MNSEGRFSESANIIAISCPFCGEFVRRRTPGSKPKKKIGKLEAYPTSKPKPNPGLSVCALNRNYCASTVNVAVGAHPVRRVYAPVGSLPPCYPPLASEIRASKVTGAGVSSVNCKLSAFNSATTESGRGSGPCD